MTCLLVSPEAGKRRGVFHETSAPEALDALTDRSEGLFRAECNNKKKEEEGGEGQ